MNELEQEKDLINFKEYIRILLKFWYVALAVILFSLVFAFYKIRYSTPIFMVKTTMHIKDKSSYSYGSKSFLEGSSMFQPFKNLKNEMELIKSYNRVRLVVSELDFTWVYSVKGSLRDIEVYGVKPFEISCDSGFIITNMPLFITIVDSDYFTLRVPGGAKILYDPIANEYVDTLVSVGGIDNVKFKFGQTISLGGLFNFKLNKTQYYNKNDNDLQFLVVGRDLHSLTREYKAKLLVSENDKSSIITISSSGSIIQKEVAFLNKLSEVYVRKELEDKNQIANNTINFIDSQLKVISDSLNNTGDEIESYRSKNKIYDFEEQSIGVITQLNELEGKKLEAELQLRYYEYLKGYLNTDKELTDLVAPSTINISDLVVNELVGQLIELYQRKNTLRYSSSEKSPAFQTLLIRIKTTKEALLENTKNMVNTSKSSIGDIDNRIAKMETQMAAIPAQQRTLINIERKHTINDEIYNYLLQKRAEASIARASNLPDAFTVESPLEDDFIQIAPTVSKIYTTYILSGIGLIIVSLIAYGKIDNKVHTKEDIIKFTDVSVLGTVGFTGSDLIEKLVHSGHGSLTESFRSIRTNLQFMVQGKQRFMIGITSCISGDGKSFCSHNLARIYAISGKKTLLVRGDMRKAFNAYANAIPSGSMGLSQYLIGLATLEQIIHTGEIDNLYQIVPGPVPPNASELVASEKMDEFILKIKDQFEVVIIDSPPVGLVSDYMSVIKHINVNIYIVRYDYTPKETLEAIKDLKSKYPKASHAIIFNGITARLLRKYSYYGNPVEYGYEAPIKKKWWRIFS
jgi:capsular exopolysaccharide synthesis family protein